MNPGLRQGLAAIALWLSAPAAAQAATPDVIYAGAAGPYAVLARVQLPDVIPGLARLDVRSATPELRSLQLLALPLDAEGSAFPPLPDHAERSAADPQLFTGQMWLMSTGSWQIRLLADGTLGPGEVSVPVSALPTRVTDMPRSLAAVLLGLLVFLALALVSIVGAAVRESQLSPDETPAAPRLRRARIALAIAAVMVCGVVVAGKHWWSVSEANYAKSVYKPLALAAEIQTRGAERRLVVTLTDPGWLPSRRVDDLLGAPGNALDLYAVAEPGRERLWHLSPEQVATGRFEVAAPDFPAGEVALFAQLVHADGLPETLHTRLTVAGAPPKGEAPVALGLRADLSGDARLVLRGDPSVEAGISGWLRFQLQDREGHPLPPVSAEAVILREGSDDFVHLRPSGTVSPGALALANPKGTPSAAPDPLSFPYAFAEPGPYRVFVEVQRPERAEVAAFELRVGAR